MWLQHFYNYEKDINFYIALPILVQMTWSFLQYVLLICRIIQKWQSMKTNTNKSSENLNIRPLQCPVDVHNLNMLRVYLQWWEINTNYVLLTVRIWGLLLSLCRVAAGDMSSRCFSLLVITLRILFRVEGAFPNIRKIGR